MKKSFRIFNLKGVPVYVHWSLTGFTLIAIVLALFNINFLAIAMVFPLLMLIHELGHMWFASRLGLNTEKIELQFLHGYCVYELAETDYENYVVAWGGVAAQAIIFIPCIFILLVFGDSLSGFFYTTLILLGYFNALDAAFNLLPIRGFDGSICWRSVPLFFKHGRIKKNGNSKKPQKKKNPFKIVK